MRAQEGSDLIAINRLHVLTRHADTVTREAAERALKLHGVNIVAYYKHLYETAERLNPFKRGKTSGWRQKCAYSAADGVQRCIVAQVFYHLACGMYYRDESLRAVNLSKVFDVSLH